MNLLAIAFALNAVFAATSLSLMSLRSGTRFQFASITIDQNGNVLVGSGDSVSLILNDDSTLADRATNKYISIDPKTNFLVESATNPAKFSIYQDFYLVGNNNEGFYACPLGNDFGVSVKECSGGTPIALKVNGAASAANFYPSSGATTLTTKTSTQPAPTSTNPPAPAPTTSTKPAPAPSPAPAPKGGFGLIAIHSGSSVQNAAIKKVASHLHVFSVGGNDGTPVTLTLKSDGSLVDQDGVGIFVDPTTGEFGDINPNPWGTEKPVTGFTVSNGELFYQGKNNWSACPSAPNVFSLANNNCVGGISISLKVVQ